MSVFSKQIEKAISKGKGYATIRRDTAIKFIQSSSFDYAKCDYHYTDDYAYDNATNFGKGNVSAETIIREIDIMSSPRCYVSVKEPNVLQVSIHSNLHYSVYFKEVETKQVTNKKLSTISATVEPTEQTTDFTPATPKQLFALYLASNRTIDTRNLPITKQTASDLIGRSKAGEDITSELEAIVNGSNETVEPITEETLSPVDVQPVEVVAFDIVDTVSDISTSFLSNNNISHFLDMNEQQKAHYKVYMIEQLQAHSITVDNSLFSALSSNGYNCIVEALANETITEQPTKSNVIQFVPRNKSTEQPTKQPITNNNTPISLSDMREAKQREREEKEQMEKALNYVIENIIPFLEPEEFKHMMTLQGEPDKFLKYMYEVDLKIKLRNKIK